MYFQITSLCGVSIRRCRFLNIIVFEFDINKSDFKAEIPIIILKKENYIEYLIESPKKNRDVNSYYVELSNNNGKLEYKLKYKEEG